MLYSLFDKKNKRILSIHAVSAMDLPFTLKGLDLYAPVMKIGHFASAPIFVTNSREQVDVLIRDRIIKTNIGISDILLLDKYIDTDNLEICQIFDGMRVVGSDEIVRPENSTRTLT